MKEKRVYGIDLGTTYSCIAHVDEHGKPAVLPNSENELTTPSVVYFESADNVVVGKDAKDVAKLYPDRVVSVVKRAMGKSDWEFTCDGKTYKPQDISSLILRKVVRDAEVLVGEKIEDVVITCPAYFGVNQKEATREAGELAGLNVRYVIPEPTAAAIAYGMQQEEDLVLLVYDLGGGTFDTTLIEVKGGSITVIATGGDHELGGKNWDDAIVSFFTDQFEGETGVSSAELLEDAELYQELLVAAERCKKALTNREKVVELVRHGVHRANVELTREKFEEITASYLERTLSLTDEMLSVAKTKGYSHVDKILLVGGATYMPQVGAAVSARFPYEAVQFDPNQAVANGAALFGYKCFLDQMIRIEVAEQTGTAADEVQLDNVAAEVREAAERKVADGQHLALPALKKFTDSTITNVTSKSFGVVVWDDSKSAERVTNLVVIDDSVPREFSQRFRTRDEGQTEADIRVMENQSRTDSTGTIELDECQDVGNAVLEFSNPLPRGSQVEVTFHLAADGLLTLTGKDLTSNRDVTATFKTEAVRSRQEVAAVKSTLLELDVS